MDISEIEVVRLKYGFLSSLSTKNQGWREYFCTFQETFTRPPFSVIPHTIAPLQQIHPSKKKPHTPTFLRSRQKCHSKLCSNNSQ